MKLTYLTIKNKSFFFIINSFFFIACSSNNLDNQEKVIGKNDTIVELTEAQYKNADIGTISVQQKNITTTIQLNGSIDVPPQNLVSISCPLGGYLKNTKLLPGMHINKGEVIATIEDQQFIQLQQDYLMTKSKLQLAELDFKRQRDLNESKASSDKIFQQSETDLNNYKIILASLIEKLKLINIDPNNISTKNISKSIFLYAPIDGFITKVNVNIGKYVSPIEILFEAVNPTDIHLNVKVFEKDISTIQIGKKIYAYTNSNPDKRYLCEVILISKDVSHDGTVDVHCHFENYDKTLLPGMYMNAEFEVSNNLSDALPDDCIVNFNDEDFVFIANNKLSYTLQKVELGSNHNGLTQIKNAKDLVGKSIVNKGAYTLLMKLKNVEE